MPTRKPARRSSRNGTTVRVTMADVRSANRRHHRERGDDFSYFDRKTSKFFGGDKFSGPYVGLGGTFFVQVNRAGIKIKRAMPSGAIQNVFDTPDFTRVDDARSFAKKLAKGA